MPYYKVMKPKAKGKGKGTKRKAATTRSFVPRPVKSYTNQLADVGGPGNGASPFPPSVRRKMTYSGFVVYSTSGGGHQFRLNSCYDPDYSGAGHQPLGFDELSTMYQRYCVHGCEWTATFLTKADSVIDVLMTAPMGTVPGDILATNPTGNQTAIERGSPWAVQMAKALTGMKLAGKVDVAKFFAIRDDQLMVDDTYSALIGTNPSKVIYLSINIVPMDNATTVNGNLFIKLIMDVTMFSPLSIGQS